MGCREGAKVSPLTAALVRAVVFLLRARCTHVVTVRGECQCGACTLRREVEREAT